MKKLIFIWPLLFVILIFTFLWTNVYSVILCSISYLLTLVYDFFRMPKRSVLNNMIMVLVKVICVGVLFLIYSDFINGFSISETLKIFFISVALFVIMFSDMIFSLFFRKKITVFYGKIVRVFVIIPLTIILYLVKAGEINGGDYSKEQIDMAIIGIVLINSFITLFETFFTELTKLVDNVPIKPNNNPPKRMSQYRIHISKTIKRRRFVGKLK